MPNTKIIAVLLLFPYPGSVVVQHQIAVFEVGFQVIYLCLVTNYLPDIERMLPKY